MNELRQMTHDEATDLAGLYVLDALDDPEREQVRRHLAECSSPHPDFEEFGGVVPALAQLVEPVDAPAELRELVMSAIAAEASATAGAGATTAAGATTPAAAGATTAAAGREIERVPAARLSVPSTEAAWRLPARRPAWLGWAAGAAAVLLIAVLGAWSFLLQARTSELEQRTALIAEAIAASTADGSAVATLQGTGPAAGASGFAAFTAQGEGYILLVGLPPAPAGQTYQAWYLVDGQPFSAGLVSVADDGIALLAGVERTPGTDLIAFTIERAGGAEQPTSDPIVSGEISA